MRTWILATLLLLGISAASCSSDQSAAGEGAEEGGDDSGVELECESEGYPCSLSDVPIKIHDRTEEIGNEVLSMLEAGSSVEEVDAWLVEQQDVAEVEFDDHAIRYRLDGGRGAWILREGAVASRGAPGAGS